MLNLVSLQQNEGLVEPFGIDHYRVNVTVKNQLAKTEVDQVFRNRNPFPVDGAYIFPIPAGAILSEVSFSVNGNPVSGELLSEEEASRLYRFSATHAGNTAIMEYNGTQAFAAKVPEIPENGERHIQFTYSQVISVESDLAKYTYPLSLAKSASGRIRDLGIEMAIQTEAELRTTFSPTYEVVVDRKDDHNVRVKYADTDVEPDEDFLCQYSLSDEDFGMTLLTHRESEAEDGYFMLCVSPKYAVPQTEIIEKDFIFVLDHSGSMGYPKMEQAKDALRYCVQNLNDRDRFNLILFDTEITSFSDRISGDRWFGHDPRSDAAVLSHDLISVVEGREKARAFIEPVHARGMTDINDALGTALAGTPDPDRPRIIVFLTDGLPTAGETNPARIQENVKRANQGQARIFVFGVGYDVNAAMLDKLAADNGGSSNYVLEHENIEEAVSALFRKMNEPMLVDVGINFGGIVTKAETPKSPPDLFRGEQLTLLGRYEGHGDTRLTLRGRIGGEVREFSKDVRFAKLEAGNDYLPHLWAQSRITECVDQAILGDSSPELRQEIEALSERYGIPTPYTPVEFETGVDGVTTRVTDTSRILSEHVAAMPSEMRIDHHREMEVTRHRGHKVRRDDRIYIGRKTFIRHGNQLIDSEYDGASELKQIEFMSEAFERLANEIPNSYLHRWSKALDRRGGSLIVCYGGVNYEVVNRGA